MLKCIVEWYILYHPENNISLHLQVGIQNHFLDSYHRDLHDCQLKQRGHDRCFPSDLSLFMAFLECTNDTNSRWWITYYIINLIPKGLHRWEWGIYGLNNHKQHHYLNRVRAKTNKILDFVLIYFWMFPGGGGGTLLPFWVKVADKENRWFLK